MRTEIATLGEFGLIKHLTEGIKLENESRDYVKRIACKAIYLDATEEYILPRSKDTILCNLLGLQLLIGENER